MEKRIFQRIGLVGAGLIGGSIAAALGRRIADAALIVHDASPGNAAYVAERHPNGSTGQFADMADCDAIFVATPVASIPGQVEALLALGGDTLVIDTGSAKAEIVSAIAASGVDAARFVPGHPLAGGISTGPGHSTPDIITARPFVLTPSEATAPAALTKARALLETLGAHVVEMDAEAHDQLLARGSHLPHLIAFALAEFAEEEVRDLLPASFRGISSYAASDPRMWADIFRANREGLAEALETFKKRLDLIAAMADEPTPGNLLETLETAKARIDALENDA
ncbi:prephenate dehydrogenase [Parasphingopyxis marina]|uniref:Prephenate dehydrogenase n=1 Tax=Parasphingopyxis marina TaxID=2761622 RepID=A0A842I3N6_9SPHN|nr:prephenate dehydrogenase [Parasphingopyxis marina]MBC2779070.1 prephenate dehydrogenase [Parasphingopyxis marina]